MSSIPLTSPDAPAAGNEPESGLPSIASDPELSSQPSREGAVASLYRVIWRWHFYAGLLVAPFMVLAAATGAIYVFHQELSGWMYQDVCYVRPEAERLSYDEQLRIVTQSPEFTELDGISLWNDPRRAVEYIAHAHPGGHNAPNQQHRVFYVNPYTGKVLGSRLMEEEFFHVVLDLHRTLFTGTTGRVLVELATSWGLVLLLTGIYLWWPRGKSLIRGVWWPRLRGKSYLVLRDLHAIAGIYTSVFAAIVLMTGLFTSVVWGSGFTLFSKKMEQSVFEFFVHAEAPPRNAQAKPSLELVVPTALKQSRPGDHVYFQLAEQPEQAHKVYLMQAGDVNTVRGLDIDQYTGELVSATQTEQLEPLVRLLALAESLHQGKTFGMVSKVIAFVTCLVLIGLTITGVWMWWERRPRGQLGFPARVVRAGVPWWVWGLVVLVGIILPTVGLSAVLIVVIDTAIKWIYRYGRASTSAGSL